MPNLHEWITVDYLGEAKQVCNRCKQAFLPEKVSEVCEGFLNNILPFTGKDNAPVNQPVRIMAASPIDFLKSLDAQWIEKKIADLESERDAWNILLQVTIARDAAKSKVMT